MKRRSRTASAVTLIELLVVVTIISVLMVLLVPAFTTLKGANNVTSGAYQIAGVLEQARTYAVANNTYVWVGFFEEDASQAPTSPATAGVGRIVLSVVGSKDGTSIYTNVASPATTIDPTRLVQLSKLTRIENAHLKTFTDGSADGETFDTRPAARYATAKIGDTTPPDASLTPVQYPVGSPAPAAQYTFTKAIEFNPAGDCRVNNSNFSVKPVVEVGLQPAHGTAPDANSKNVAAVQLSGLSGAVKIYRR